MPLDPDEAQEGNLSHDDEISDDDNAEDDEIPFLNVGRERFVSDRRQLGGLCLVLGTCATFQPLATIASLVGFEDEDAPNTLSNVETVVLISAVLQFLFGTLAMVVGYLSLIHDYGHYLLTGSLIVFTQLAWMPFITGMVQIGQAASAPFTTDTTRTTSNGTVLLEEYVVNPFIPPIYLPTQLDVQFFGAMGILGIMAYGTGFLGSLAFTEFALYAFDVGKPTHRDARYFRGRLVFYSFVLALAGVSQLLLGSYILFEIGGGPLSPPVGIAMYQVYFPEITVAIGSVQMVVGYIGIARYLNYLPTGPNDHEMQGAAFLGWFLQLVLQYIVQISYGMGDENAAALPSLALLSLGMNLLPAYLDYKMRTTPHYLTKEYYGISHKGTFKPLNHDNKSLVDTTSKPTEELKQSRDIQAFVVQEPTENPEDPSMQEDQGNFMPLVPSDTEEDLTEPLEAPTQYQLVDDKEVDEPPSDVDFPVPEVLDNNEETNVTQNDDDSPTEVDQSLVEPVETKVPEGLENADQEDNDSGDDIGENKEIEARPGGRQGIDEEEEGVIIVEEFVEYPEDYEPDDHDNDDRTPPQSNKSIETDLEDTWEKSLTPPKRLSPLEEEDSERILAEEQDDDDLNMIAVTPGETQSSESGKLQDPPTAKDSVPTSARSIISEYSMDYSTPSDDSVALDAKINRLQQDLLSDTDMESYLNNIL